MQDRIRHARMHDRLMSPEQAAGLISGHQTVAMSGFTGAGYPKSVPHALAARMEAAAAAGGPFRIKVLTGASTAPQLYGTALPPDRKPIPLTAPGERIGEPYLYVDPAKVVAVCQHRRARAGTPPLATPIKPPAKLPGTCWTSSTMKSSVEG